MSEAYDLYKKDIKNASTLITINKMPQNMCDNS